MEFDLRHSVVTVVEYYEGVTHDRSTSRCSNGAELRFHYFDWVSRPDVEAIDAAVGAFMEAITTDTRRWNIYNRSVAKAACKKRLERAVRGELTPVEEVKGVDEENSAPLYEIRWQNVAVTDQSPEEPSQLVFSEVQVRMYHSEPDVYPEHFIAHHVHEKVVDDDSNIYQLQDDEIAVARRVYTTGENVKWGLT